MEFANRRLLLLNEDVPTKHATNNNNSTTTSSQPPESSTTVESPLQVSIRPVFASNVAYVFLILFTTFFFIGFVFLYFRQFSTETVSFRRRREEVPSSSSSSSSSSAAKAMMPVVAHEGERGECAICLEELGEGEEVKVIPYCKHVFHPECIDTWLDKHVTCPVCRCSKLCEKEQEVGSVSE